METAFDRLAPATQLGILEDRLDILEASMARMHPIYMEWVARELENRAMWLADANKSQSNFRRTALRWARRCERSIARQATAIMADNAERLRLLDKVTQHKSTYDLP